MTVGDKIKKIRTFRGMTQKELGLAIGFEEKGADNRIAQYETNYRVPKRELLDKINGLSYEEIARRGGGILNSADRLHETSEDELYAQAMERVREIAAMGTGCVEIKSGYGLSTGDELKLLRVIRRNRDSVPLEVRATFLGAHAVARA